ETERRGPARSATSDSATPLGGIVLATCARPGLERGGRGSRGAGARHLASLGAGHRPLPARAAGRPTRSSDPDGGRPTRSKALAAFARLSPRRTLHYPGSARRGSGTLAPLAGIGADARRDRDRLELS